MLLNKYNTGLGRVTPKVVVLLYTDHLLEMWCEEVRPVVGGNYHASILIIHKLRKVTLSRIVHYLCFRFQTPNLGSSVVSLEKPKAPIW